MTEILKVPFPARLTSTPTAARSGGVDAVE